jgi:2-polyprenyl-3-methyl-5-hydroxy-6-metoxy-1,4-benzoquinol methylase
MAGVIADAVRDLLTRALPQAPPLDQRMVAWPPDSLVPRACPVCADDEAQPFVRRPDGLPVARCRRCDMIYLPLVPSDAALAEFYDRYSDMHQRWHRAKTAADAIAAARRRRGGNGLLHEMTLRRALAGKRLLEIGCSRGSFLLDAREAGAHVTGVEIDAGARRFLAELGIECHAELPAAAHSAGYDAIVALNVIEHLPTPRQWLRDINRLLNRNGLLALWTPNGGQATALGAGWIGFRVDLDHLNYFSMATLGRLLLDEGLWPEATWELSQANLSAFTGAAPAAPGRLLRLQRACRPPVRTWAVPSASGAFTLGMFAGKP